MNVDRVIDTNFLISRWRKGKKSPAAAWLLAHPELSLGIPWIVKAEFLRGAAVAGHDLHEVRVFLTRYPTIWPNEESLEIYANLFAVLRQRNALIGPHDLWIAVAALQCRVALVTRNIDEFGKVPELQVERY